MNNGTLDLITGGAGLPGNFSNGANGVVLESDVVKIKSASRAGTVFTITINGYTGHTYQLQRATSLEAGVDFVNLGASQEGVTGGTLTFEVDDAVEVARAFYRVGVD